MYNLDLKHFNQFSPDNYIFITLIKDLKKVYLLYRRNTTGETKNIFESEGNNENLPPAITTKTGLGF